MLFAPFRIFMIHRCRTIRIQETVSYLIAVGLMLQWLFFRLGRMSPLSGRVNKTYGFVPDIGIGEFGAGTAAPRETGQPGHHRFMLMVVDVEFVVRGAFLLRVMI